MRIVGFLLFLLMLSGADAQEVEPSLADLLPMTVYRNPSDAMEPTIRPGEIIYVDVRAKEPKPGEVIAYKFDTPSPTLLVKRTIALGGSKVQFRRWKLFVNDKEIPEPYVDPNNVTGTSSFEYGPVTVKGDCVFVLADNRDRGNDSRTQGCVPASEVVGIVRFVAPSTSPFKARRVK